MGSLEDALQEAQGDGFVEADFSASEEFENPPVGTYDVEVVKSAQGKSKAKNPVIKVEFKVTDGTYKGKLFASLNYTGKAAWKLRKFLRAMGFDLDGDKFKLNPADLVGKVGRAEVTEDSAKFSSVNMLYPLEGGGSGDTLE